MQPHAGANLHRVSDTISLKIRQSKYWYIYVTLLDYFTQQVYKVLCKMTTLESF